MEKSHAESVQGSGKTGRHQQEEALLKLATKDVPEVLNRCKIQETGGPVYARTPLMLHEVNYRPSAMRSGVVVQKYAPLSQCLQSWDDERLHDHVSVSDGSQLALNVVKRGSAMKMEASTHHH